MKNTKTGSNQKREKNSGSKDVKTQPLALTKPSEHSGNQVQRMNLSTSVAEHLLNAMKQVTKDTITPQTVHAACMCAKEIREIIKLNNSL